MRYFYASEKPMADGWAITDMYRGSILLSSVINGFLISIRTSTPSFRAESLNVSEMIGRTKVFRDKDERWRWKRWGRGKVGSE